jgi:SAM-dependent methyltransferase
MKTNFDAIDFNALYKIQKKASSHKKKGVELWNEKAVDMDVKKNRGIYNKFIQDKISLSGVESLLDVGCGPGTFALYYAPLLKKVVAFDFSSKMLEKLEKNAKDKNLKNIEILNANIEGDWANIPTCDVVLASRCLEVDSLKKVLKKLNSHAKKAVYLTFKAGNSYINDEFLQIIKRDVVPRPDYIYVLNTLYQMGIFAKLDFVPKEDSEYCKAPDDVDKYINSISWSLEGLSEDEEKRAREYFSDCQKKGISPVYKNNAWALIYWEK